MPIVVPTTFSASDLIVSSFKLATIIGEGQTLSGEQSINGLQTLNDMLGAWNLDDLMLWQTDNTTVTLVPGQSFYTVGASANFDMDRPVQINSMYVTYQGVSFQVFQVNQDEYNLITLKGMTQILPRFFLYVNDSPMGHLTLWPIPQAVMSLTIAVNRLITDIPTLATQISVPPGYRKCLRANLAVELCPEYGREPSQTLAKMAQASKADVKRANVVSVVAEYDPFLLNAPGGLAGFLSGY